MIVQCYVTLQRRGSLVELPAAWMDELYELEEHRRQGEARALFAAAERAARDKGALRLDLLAWAFSAPALAFCRSPGVTILRRTLEKLF